MERVARARIHQAVSCQLRTRRSKPKTLSLWAVVGSVSKIGWVVAAMLLLLPVAFSKPELEIPFLLQKGQYESGEHFFDVRKGLLLLAVGELDIELELLHHRLGQRKPHPHGLVLLLRVQFHLSSSWSCASPERTPHW